MAARAGVSECVFGEIFATIEDCYRAAYEQGLQALSRTVDEAADRERTWLERVRSGLVALLGFFDDEPYWARLLLLETPVGTAVAFECRQQLHDVLGGLLDTHTPVPDVGRASCGAGSPMALPSLTGELVVGGVFSVIRTSLLEDEGGKMVELALALLAFITMSYYGHPAVQDEPKATPSHAGASLIPPSDVVRTRALLRAAGLPIRATHRTTLVLRAIARAPYANNREIALVAGITDEGQTSKLLARLEQHGIIENVGVGPARGEPNAWLLTRAGQRAVELLDPSLNFRTRYPRGTRARGAA